MIDGYLETNDIRDAIIEMSEEGLVLVGNIGCYGHELKYVKQAYHAKMNGKLVLILETENFVPKVSADGQET
jgi:hypothetical protein